MWKVAQDVLENEIHCVDRLCFHWVSSYDAIALTYTRIQEPGVNIQYDFEQYKFLLRLFLAWIIE